MSSLTPWLPAAVNPSMMGVLLIAIAFVAYICIKFFYVDIPIIQGIPEIPGGDLLAGHLHALGPDHATMAERWSLSHEWPIFQMRMGRRRAVVLNTFESAREWLVKNQSSTLDRPWFYTFHGVISSTSAATIGTSPWNERTKKQRRIVGSLTTGPSIQRLGKMLDLETCAMISGLHYDSNKGAHDIMPHIYQKRVALNMMTMFCYGTRFSSVTNPLLLQILSDASTIASFRSTNSNPQDFIPHLRYLSRGSRTSIAVEVRERRDKWLATMLERVRQRLGIEKATGKSVAEMLLSDNREGLTPLDIKTILGGLMSGGFETIFSTAIIAIGVLASETGQSIQEAAYENILASYSSPEEAFASCVSEEKCSYIAALVKETLRFYPPLKLLPARQTYKPFDYHGSIIPKGVLIYVNTQAVNRDKTTYGDDADQFRPERWLGDSQPVPPPYHFAFGAGARMCTAVNFSNRVLYAIFLRLIVSFRISESDKMPANTHYVQYKRDPAASNAIASDFKVKFEPRDVAALERCLVQSQDNVSGLVDGDSSEDLKRDI